MGVKCNQFAHNNVGPKILCKGQGGKLSSNKEKNFRVNNHKAIPGRKGEITQNIRYVTPEGSSLNCLQLVLSIAKYVKIRNRTKDAHILMQS